jgi:hypothetical protein
MRGAVAAAIACIGLAATAGSSGAEVVFSSNRCDQGNRTRHPRRRVVRLKPR